MRNTEETGGGGAGTGWPVATILGLGCLLSHRQHRQTMSAFGGALEHA